MLLNLTRIVESVLASSEDSVEQELRRLELEFEKLQMDWQNTAPKWEAKTLPPRGRPEVFIDLNQIVCVVNTCGYVRQLLLVELAFYGIIILWDYNQNGQWAWRLIKGVGVMTKYGIDSTVIHQIIDLANRHHIQTVILFGSRARGDFHRTSDIDLAVQGGMYAVSDWMLRKKRIHCWPLMW